MVSQSLPADHCWPACQWICRASGPLLEGWRPSPAARREASAEAFSGHSIPGATGGWRCARMPFFSLAIHMKRTTSRASLAGIHMQYTLALA